MSLRFPKSEKLKSRKTINQLFEEGRVITAFPVKVIYLPRNNGELNQAAFSVPKRNFRTAVGRNRIKRQLREAYRLHKQLLIANSQVEFALLFLYIGKAKPRFTDLETAFKTLLEKIAHETN